MPYIEGMTLVQPDGFTFSPGLEGDLLNGGPILGSPWWCTSDYDQPRDNGLGYHGALDGAPVPWGPRALPIVGTNGGWLELAFRWNRISGPGGSYGNVVILRHDDGEATLYAHLERFAFRIEEWLNRGALVEERPYIVRGELVGWMGNTGNVWPTPATPDDLETGKHLHFECRSTVATGSVLLDPESRIRFGMPIVTPPPGLPPEPDDPNPTPDAPLDLSYSAALDEARMLRFLAQALLDHPLPYEDALSALEREVREFIESFGVATGTALDEARVLLQSIGLYRTLPPDQYGTVIARVRDEAGEQVDALTALV